MPSLLQHVSKLCSDGKAVQHSDGSVHVMNCPYWSPSASAMLQYDCPGAVISVQSSLSSLSGFVVVVRQPEVSRRGGLFMAWVVAMLVFGCIWYGMREMTEECTASFFNKISVVAADVLLRQWPKNGSSRV